MASHNGPHVHDFCRHLLAETMKEVRKQYAPIAIKSAWCWEGARKHFEFHGPNGEYQHNLKLADCKWSAMAEGWQQLLSARELKCPICDADPGKSCVRHDNPKAPWQSGVHADRLDPDAMPLTAKGVAI